MPVIATALKPRGAAWSPEQIALTLGRIYPKTHKSRVSHEMIYNCLYDHPVGELRLDIEDRHFPGAYKLLPLPHARSLSCLGQASQYPPKYCARSTLMIRPRKGLGVRSPLAVCCELLINNPQHLTLVR